MSDSMSFEERRAAHQAAFEKDMRRSNRSFVLLMVGTLFGTVILFFALVIAFPFIRLGIRQIWAYYGVL